MRALILFLRLGPCHTVTPPCHRLGDLDFNTQLRPQQPGWDGWQRLAETPMGTEVPPEDSGDSVLQQCG